MFECKTGRVDDQKLPCISAAQRCDNIKDCRGGEDELAHNCPCEPEGAIRLVDGSGPHEGRVEFCRKSVWATVCNRYNQWRTSGPAVVCRQLGYTSQGEKHTLQLLNHFAYNNSMCMIHTFSIIHCTQACSINFLQVHD